jgi:site-specific DNA recombinase
VLGSLKRSLLAPEYVAEFIRAFHAEINRQRRDAETLAGAKRRELEELERRLDGLIDAIADGLRAPGLQAKLDQLDSRRTDLQRELDAFSARGEKKPYWQFRLQPRFRKIDFSHPGARSPSR